MQKVSVFISHSHRDESLAAGVALLIQQALGLVHEEIRCTSALGYRLASGVDIDRIIRSDIEAAKALVVLLTPASLESRYVLFELGARWGANLPVIPMLARGTRTVDIPDPIRRFVAVRGTDADDLHQLLDDISHCVDRPLQAAQVYLPHLRSVISLSEIDDRLNALRTEVIQGTCARPIRA